MKRSIIFSLVVLAALAVSAFGQQSYLGGGALSTWNRDATSAGVFLAGAVTFPTGSVGDFSLNGLFSHESFNAGGAKPAVDARLRYLPPEKLAGFRPFAAVGFTVRRVGVDAQWWPTVGGGVVIKEYVSVYGDYLIGDPANVGRARAFRYGAQGLLPLGRANNFDLLLFGDVTKSHRLPSQYRAGVGVAYEFK